MFMQKIEAPRITCDLFDVAKGWKGTGSCSNAPRQANEAEALAYADFIRRKNDLPELCKPVLARGSYPGGGRRGGGDLLYIGATYGAQTERAGYCSETRERTPAQYEAGAFSVLFPGANMMRQAVTLETLDDAGEVLTRSTMPLEPKKGGIVWSKDEVRKACGPVAKVKAARTPTVAKRRAAPTVDKRRRAVLMALRLRKQLRISRDIAHDRLCQLAENARQNAAKRNARPDAPATAPDAILSDLAEAERLMRGAGYVAQRPLSMREAFRALYRIARRDKLEGSELLHAACDLTGEPHETFKCWRACELHRAVTRALDAVEPMRFKLGRLVLNCWGHGNPYRSPAMESPRFPAWRRTVSRADALRKRLADAGRLELDAGNWVVRVLPLPVTPEPAPTSEGVKPDPRDYARPVEYLRAIAGTRLWFVGRWSKSTRERYEFRFTPAEYDAACNEWQEAHRDATPTTVTRKARAPAYERAIRRAWAERQAFRKQRAMAAEVKAEMKAAWDRQAELQEQSFAHYDRALNAEHEAREALSAREAMRALLTAAERRAENAEAENAELWAEIEALTAPIAGVQGAIPVRTGAA